MSKSKKRRSGRNAANHKNPNRNKPVQSSNEPSPQRSSSHKPASVEPSSQLSLSHKPASAAPSPQISSSLKPAPADPPVYSEPADSQQTTDKSGGFSSVRIKPGRLLLTAAGAVVCLLTIQYFNSRMAGSFPGGDLSTNLSKTGSTANIVTQEDPAAQDASSDSGTTAQAQKPAADTRKSDPQGTGTPASAENHRPDPASSEDSRPDPAANEDRHTNEDPELPDNEEEFGRGEEYEEEYEEEDYDYYEDDGHGEEYEEYEEYEDNGDYEEYEDYEDEDDEYWEDDEDGHIHGLD